MENHKKCLSTVLGHQQPPKQRQTLKVCGTLPMTLKLFFQNTFLHLLSIMVLEHCLIHHSKICSIRSGSVTVKAKAYDSRNFQTKTIQLTLRPSADACASVIFLHSFIQGFSLICHPPVYCTFSTALPLCFSFCWTWHFPN